jgi:hypothetical protein
VKSARMLVAAVAATAMLGIAASPAAAQSQQEGLINVAVEDVTVQLPIAVAANVCDLNVNVLSQMADQAEPCTATADSAASAGPSGNGNIRQEGLVNVLVDDVVVQAPIAVAANVCDVNVNVLANMLDDANACTAVAGADAQPGQGQGGANAGAFTPVSIAGLMFLDNLPSTTGSPTPTFPPVA